MFENLQNDLPYTEEDLRWKELYKIGAITNFIVAVLVVFAVIAFLIWPFTAGVISTEEIFITLQNDLLGGLIWCLMVVRDFFQFERQLITK